MSYVAFATDSFDAMAAFYGEDLAFPVVDGWDRENGRGRRFDLGGGLRLELLDNTRERHPVPLDVSARVHVVIEVADVDRARETIAVPAPACASTSWGARLFQIHDPDGVPVTFLQWADREGKFA